MIFFFNRFLLSTEFPYNIPYDFVLFKYATRCHANLFCILSTEDGTSRDVVVEIERTTRKKPFMGGYRHKETNAEFHHASAQTVSKQRPVSTVERFCRDTQTVAQRHTVQQTTNHTSTQMTGIGVYVSNMEDKLIVPGKYTTADEHKAKLLQQVMWAQLKSLRC